MPEYRLCTYPGRSMMLHKLCQSNRDALIGGKKNRKYHDLDSLAGTWTAAEAAEFDASVNVFESVDPELWDR